MPTIFRHGAFRVFFYSNEGDPREAVHVHVRSGSGEAKVVLEPDVHVSHSRGLGSRTLGEIVDLVRTRRREIERAWHDHFGD